MMKSDNDYIELRSEKARNIIGQIPPIIIRFGISIIFLIICGLFTGLHFVKYEYIIVTDAIVKNQNNSTIVNLTIPANEIRKLKQGDKVLIFIDGNLNLYNERIETSIQKVPELLYISDNKSFYIAVVELPVRLQTNSGKEFKILSSIELKAEILTEKESIYNRFLDQFRIYVDSK